MFRQMTALSLALACALCIAAAVVAEDKAAPKWAEILNPATADLPAPHGKVVWLDDFNAALALAKKEGRPLFVTLRCLPCKQCAKFDAEVLKGSNDLDPLLKQFVTVRLTSMRNVDSRILPYEDYQDLDLSWWGYFLSDSGQLYGVYGGRDEVSDSTRVSVAGLTNALAKVLAHHYDKRRAGWNIDAPVPDLKGAAKTPKQLAGWASWAKRGAREAADSECLHCHQVNEVIRQPACDAGSFDKHKDFYGWPFPENIGLTLDRDTGLMVTKVAKGSEAEKAGVKVGDEIGAAGGQRIFTQTDLRGVLHRCAGGKLELVWTHKGEVMRAALELKGDWRRTNLGWRKSVAEADVGANTGLPWPLKCSDKERKSRSVAAGRMCVKPYFPKGPTGPAGDAGLKSDDFIVAVNGDTTDVSDRAFLVWFRLKFEPGDEVKLTVIGSDGKQRELKYKAPGRSD
ncbi:MAG: PDZ domain-containing protein [Planctomycetes bacterium]|nr:PDZ domain-containing protein [Planctomycetota bacterium]